MEIDSHSLYSKYFSESAKLVGQTFEALGKIIREEPDTFVCILIDEVESLTGSRDQGLGGNEPRDAIRVSTMQRWRQTLGSDGIAGSQRSADRY